MTTIPLEIQLKRARLARDYWLQIPPEKVCPDLRYFTDGLDELKLFHISGLDALSCNAVACLGGWLRTMPEFRDQWPLKESLEPALVLAWLGKPFGLFTVRLRHEPGTDWEVALTRLDSLIAHIESGQNASMWRNAPKGATHDAP